MQRFTYKVGLKQIMISILVLLRESTNMLHVDGRHPLLDVWQVAKDGKLRNVDELHEMRSKPTPSRQVGLASFSISIAFGDTEEKIRIGRSTSTRS